MSSSGKSPSLSDRLAKEIREGGPMSFARFMELALYDPDEGYYGANRAVIGKEGDFFTNVSVGAVFGRILADQIAEMWERLGQPTDFCIVEQAANDGRLAVDIIQALPTALKETVRYLIVEPIHALEEKQRESLAAFSDQVRWFPTLGDLPDFDGVHFSNELIDALPFHLVQCDGTNWHELKVHLGSEGFGLEAFPASPELASFLAEWPAREAGTVAEVRPAANMWLEEVSKRLRQGYILIVDYGFSQERLLAPFRKRGTFSCYIRHQRDEKPLENPGGKDITAHVDFSQLAKAAQNLGLHLEGFTDQHHFIVNAGEKFLRSVEQEALNPSVQKTLRGFQTLLHPESMGTQFHYLAFSKDVPSTQALAGFRHSRLDDLFAQPEVISPVN